MKKGYIIDERDESNTSRNLLSGTTKVVSGGEDNEGVSRLGDTLMFDGRTVADGSYGKKVGVFKDSSNRLRYNGDFVKDYPLGVTNMFSISANTTYTYPNGTTGAKQGAAIYHNKFYQFYEGGHCITYDILKGIEGSFDIPTNIWPNTGANNNHISSAQFSNEFENEEDELPLLYTSVAHTVCVINLNGTPRLVRYFVVPFNPDNIINNPPHPSFCVVDFESSKGLAWGYPEGVSNNSTSHKDDGRFEVIEFTFPRSGQGNVSSSLQIDYENRREITMQDAIYLNKMPSDGDMPWSNMQSGYAKNEIHYILFGGTHGNANRVDRIKILIYNSNTKKHYVIYTGIGMSPIAGAEGEGIVPFKNGFIISSLHQGEKLFVPDPDLI